MNLENMNISYLLLTSDKLDDVMSVLYSKDYHIIEMKEHSNGKYKDTLLAYGLNDNDSIREDVLFLLEEFGIKSGVVKYIGEKNPKRILNDGSEKLLGINTYSDNVNDTYIYKGLSFSFYEEKRYWTPKDINDFRIGMVVEYFNNNKWCEKLVEDPNKEWNNIYKLMVKYNKVRVLYK